MKIKKVAKLFVLFSMFVFCTSCGGQNKPDPQKETSQSETKDLSTSGWIDTKYEYIDSIGKNLIIQNGLPKGGTKYPTLSVACGYGFSYKIPPLAGTRYRFLLSGELALRSSIQLSPLSRFGSFQLGQFAL